MTKVVQRCAIYTRKSSDEGLDQSFNSLDAQREAGEAYVRSQAGEGWKVIATRYDDGGYSGGTMERPGLQRLLDDLDAGRIDVVVVYKIDRLTRSLADFARIVERFDARGVSFVSVTQAFNTTSSMGRLTLNVLLSFAQFEREVTGERIRDKIAASKAKGMWMGGLPPMGYDLPAAGTRTLVVNETDAVIVRLIFARYIELGSVHQLERVLAADGVVSRRHETATGKSLGGQRFSRGALFHLLRNQIYRGKIVHKGQTYDGQHLPIVDADLFERAQRHLDANARRHSGLTERRVVMAPLTGKLVDATGEPMSPAFSRGQSGRIYRYYVSASLQQGGRNPDDGVVRRIGAPAIDALVEQTLARLLPHEDQRHLLLRKVRLGRQSIHLTLAKAARRVIIDHLDPDDTVASGSDAGTFELRVPVTFPRRGGPRSVARGARSDVRLDTVLIAALRKAHAMTGRAGGMPMVGAAPVSPYDRKILRLAFLAPDLQADILAGRQPPSLTLEKLIHSDIALSWAEQRIELSAA